MSEDQILGISSLISKLIMELILNGTIILSPYERKRGFSTTITLKTSIDSNESDTNIRTFQTYKVSWNPTIEKGVIILEVVNDKTKFFVVPDRSLENYLSIINTIMYRKYNKGQKYEYDFKSY